MKSTLLTENQIDWTKSQLLINSSGDIVLSAGVELNDRLFSGTVIYQNSNDKNSQIGTYSNNWYKKSFRLLPKDDSIQLQND